MYVNATVKEKQRREALGLVALKMQEILNFKFSILNFHGSTFLVTDATRIEN